MARHLQSCGRSLRRAREGAACARRGPSPRPARSLWRRKPGRAAHRGDRRRWYRATARVAIRVLRLGSGAGMQRTGTAPERTPVSRSTPSPSPRPSVAAGTNRYRAKHGTRCPSAARRAPSVASRMVAHTGAKRGSSLLTHALPPAKPRPAPSRACEIRHADSTPHGPQHPRALLYARGGTSRSRCRAPIACCNVLADGPEQCARNTCVVCPDRSCAVAIVGGHCTTRGQRGGVHRRAPRIGRVLCGTTPP